MTRTIGSALVAVVLLSGCFAVVRPSSPYGYAEGYPPAAYIATATPVYYLGYPSYWYGDRWYRRDGNGWYAYRQEPPYLRDHRIHGAVPVVRQSYGRGHYGNPPRVHGAVRVGGGGHRR